MYKRRFKMIPEPSKRNVLFCGLAVLIVLLIAVGTCHYLLQEKQPYRQTIQTEFGDVLNFTIIEEIVGLDRDHVMEITISGEHLRNDCDFLTISRHGEEPPSLPLTEFASVAQLGAIRIYRLRDDYIVIYNGFIITLWGERMPWSEAELQELLEDQRSQMPEEERSNYDKAIPQLHAAMMKFSASLQ